MRRLIAVIVTLAVPAFASAEIKPSLHVSSLLTRSSEPTSGPEHSYFLGAGADFFGVSINDGQVLLGGANVSPAYDLSQNSFGMTYAFVPLTVRIRERGYAGLVLQRGGIGMKTKRWFFNSHHAIGLEVSMCLFGCR